MRNLLSCSPLATIRPAMLRGDSACDAEKLKVTHAVQRMQPPQRMQYVVATAVVAMLVAVAVVATPMAHRQMKPVPGFLIASGTSLIVTNLLLACLLFSRGSVRGQGSTVRVGAAYFFAAAMQVPWLASFPGGFVAAPLIGSDATPVWLWIFGHVGFSLAIIRYAWVRDDARTSVAISLIVCVAAAIILTVIATAGLPWLPLMLADGHIFLTGVAAYVPPFMLAIVAAALLLVVRGTSHSILRLWLAVGLVAEAFDIWLLYHGAARYALGWYLANCGGLFTSLVVLIATLHDITVIYHRMAAMNDVLTSLALIDGLTGLANRRRFDERLLLEWRWAQSRFQPLSLLMIDVDFFKQFNDHYGHLAGDDCLRQVAMVLQSTVRRSSDLVARYGGEEFVLLLPETSEEDALSVANRVHATLLSRALPHEASPFGFVTVSVGISTMRPNEPWTRERLLTGADGKLYAAKQAGRNCTCAEPP